MTSFAYTLGTRCTRAASARDAMGRPRASGRSTRSARGHGGTEDFKNGYAAFDERNQPREENRHQVLGIGSYQQFPAMGCRDPIDTASWFCRSPCRSRPSRRRATSRCRRCTSSNRPSGRRTPCRSTRTGRHSSRRTAPARGKQSHSIHVQLSAFNLTAGRTRTRRRARCRPPACRSSRSPRTRPRTSRPSRRRRRRSSP